MSIRRINREDSVASPPTQDIHRNQMHTTSLTPGTIPAPSLSRLWDGSFRLLPLLAVILVAGCDSLVAPDLEGDLNAIPGSHLISGTASAGVDGFYFLPPMLEQPSYSGSFDPNLSPVVEICAGSDCTVPHASFDMSGGKGAERVRLDEGDEHYLVTWNTRTTGVEAGQTYRVRVRAGDLVLGSADVKVVQNNQQAKSVDPSQYIALVAGRTLPIRFRIEEGIIAQIAVSPEEASISVGGTQQFVATAYDLHGQILASPPLSWSSSGDAVATVDQSGLATGIGGGSATVMAAIGSLSGAASLTVESLDAESTEWLFSNCGATGAAGPSQSQCDSAYAGSSLEGTVSISEGIQTWTAPVAGAYRITAVGARGASGDPNFLGGRGAEIAGDFELAAGDVLRLAVGQMGLGQSSTTSGGGGGGSFVVSDDDEPFLIAGGGAGTRGSVTRNGCDAQTGPFGGVGSGTSASSSCLAKTTAEGLGGRVSVSTMGSAGAGFFGDGATDVSWAQGGRSWANGILGGAPTDCGVLASGGFGGGGSGQGCHGGGGGGGYSGGDGGRLAGGGGSFNSGANQSATAGAGTAHGWIRIERLDS
jgi:hypothetical protein